MLPILAEQAKNGHWSNSFNIYIVLLSGHILLFSQSSLRGNDVHFHSIVTRILSVSSRQHLPFARDVSISCDLYVFSKISGAIK